MKKAVSLQVSLEKSSFAAGFAAFCGKTAEVVLVLAGVWRRLALCLAGNPLAW